LKIELTVKFNDGTTRDVDAVFADFVSFERTWNRSITQFEKELRLTDLAWLAWNSLKRKKLVDLPFDPDWISLVESIEIRDEEEGSEDIPLA
jgi:hypothetical protein